MRKLLTVALASLSLLGACTTQRTVYDEYGKEVQGGPHEGSVRDFDEYMEEKFNSSFSEKKNGQGVPQAVSNKVSSFQSRLDESKRIDKEYVTSSFSGTGESALSGKQYAGSGRFFGTKKEYAGAEGRLTRELNPAFATHSKGIYGTDAIYTGANEQSALSGAKSDMDGEFYTKENSIYSRDTKSGYVETRREKTLPTPVYSSHEYMGRTIEETRTLLGRDKPSED